MKFVEFLYESNISDRYEGKKLDSIDKALSKFTVAGSSAKGELLNKWDSLMKRYKNDYSGKVWRGLNFKTKSEYEKFMDTIKDGYIEIDNVTSWSRDKKTAKIFSVTMPTYAEFVDHSNIPFYEKERREKEHVYGYRGVVLQIEIDKGVGIDTSKSDIGIEDEIIIKDGRYKVEYRESLTNSDLIDKIGLKQLLSKLKPNSSRLDTIFDNIVLKHKDKLTDDVKTMLWKNIGPKNTDVDMSYSIVTEKQTYSRDYTDEKNSNIYRNNNLFDKYGNVIVIDISPIKQNDGLFLDKDYDAYFESVRNKAAGMIREVTKKLKSQEYKDINFTVIGLRNNIVKFYNLGSEVDYLRSYLKKEYSDTTSKKAIDDINKLSGKDKYDAIEDYKEKLMKLLNTL